MTATPAERVQLCPNDLRREALELLYRHVDEGPRGRIVDDALAEAEGGVIDLSGLWVAFRRGRMVGTLLTQPLAGRAAAVWAPEILEGWGRASTARSLLIAATETLQSQGIRIAQALLDESAPPRAAADLTRGGLPRVTVLDYLQRDTVDPIPLSNPIPRIDFDWRPFGPETADEFRSVLQATYAGSLDMPELEGVRSLDDVVAGHRSAGRFDPSRWLVGRVPGEPEASAVVLLSEVAERDAWEVAYLGLTPAARGRGLGRLALEHARALAQPRARYLELAVDRRNLPADRLYRSAGFRQYDRRAVHLAILNPRPEPARTP